MRRVSVADEDKHAKSRIWVMVTWGIASVSALLMFTPGCAVADALEEIPSITVLGSGTVTAKPDIARIRIGAVTHHASASQALRTNNEAMRQLLDALQEQGIPKQDLQTSTFRLSPQYHHNTRGQIPDIVGYKATNVLQATVRKLDTVGDLIDEAVKAGANHIENITFSVDDRAGLKDKARHHAIRDAHHKAALYAQAAGVTLGRVLKVEETSRATPLPMRQFEVAGGGSPLEPGEIEFRVDVTVVYGIDESAR